MGDIDNEVANSFDKDNGEVIYRYRWMEEKYLDLRELEGGGQLLSIIKGSKVKNFLLFVIWPFSSLLKVINAKKKEKDNMYIYIFNNA